MNNSPAGTRHGAFWFTVAAALLYCVWLGWHWLPLGYSDKELAAFVSRVWDVKRELDAGHGLPWWTPFYMSGSSYGLNHSQGLYLVPCLLFAKFVSVPAAVKLTSLLAIFAGALAMYGCARHFTRHGWAAALAALAFLLHPAQLIRAAGAEHLGVIVFMPFMPLTFWLLARALETGKVRDCFLCALGLTGLLWAHNKMAFIHGVFLAGYLVYHLWPAERRAEWKVFAKRLGLTGAFAVLLAAPLIIPGLLESKQVKLLSGEGEQLVLWQKNYSFKSLLGLVDRDGWLTGHTTTELQRLLQAQAFRPTSQAEADQMRGGIQRLFSLNADSPEKYAGVVLLAVLGVTILFNQRRANRRFFWFATGLLLLSVMLASGWSTVGRANWETFRAITGLPGLPSATTGWMWFWLLVAAAVLGLFYWRKLTTPAKRGLAAGLLAVFLFVPAFKLLALVPFFKEVRAPYVFYDGPGAFLMALLIGFFVTDVVKSRAPQIVAVIALFLLLDYLPYQKPTQDNGVPARTLANLESTYRALQSDPAWVKTYSLSGRYFHLLGPQYSGKPQVYEAFFNWMAPLGTGLLNQRAFEQHPVFLNLVGARYIVFDKTDPSSPGMQPLADFYRRTYPVLLENEDFAVFRNPTAREYLTGYRAACLYAGDVRDSAAVALTLAGRNWPLIHDAPESLGFARVYRSGHDLSPPVGENAAVPLEIQSLTRARAGLVEAKLNVPAQSWVVINESYYPWWRATVDGQPVELYRANCGLMAVALPAGEHALQLQYQPPKSYGWGLAVSGLALAAGLLLIRR